MSELNQRLSYFLASAPDPTLIVDGSGSIIFASAQVEPAFGYAPRELIGSPVELLMPERFRAGHTSLFKAYFRAPTPRPMGAGLRLYAQRKNGSEFPVEISLSPLQHESSNFVACAIRDVSERYEMEARLRSTASEAERANAVKSRFLAAASHDLRQPLQAATLYLSLLSKQARTPDQQELCTKMRAPLQVMSSILDALLDISMLDSGLVTPKLSDFALTSILERIAVDLRPLAEQKKLIFDLTETDVLVSSDAALLERIVENLVSNAIRYTAQGKVSVRSEIVGDFVRVSVADTGIGIPEEAIERIFDEYFQFDNPARNIKKGLGLGLAIVKRLAQLLNHPLHVRSTLGSGSIFSVDLPLARDAAVAAALAPSGRPERAAQRLAVLFIDDDAAVADSLSMVLAAYGLNAVGASNGNDAVARVQEGLRPDVVLSDYRMPNENGLEVIARLRQALGRDTPAIMMTGDTSLRHIEQKNIVNLKVLQKPVDPDALVAFIHEMAARRTD
jgi:PAS domain S-box-containing protein